MSVLIQSQAVFKIDFFAFRGQGTVQACRLYLLIKTIHRIWYLKKLLCLMCVCFCVDLCLHIYKSVCDVVMSQLCYRNREALCPHD